MHKCQFYYLLMIYSVLSYGTYAQTGERIYHRQSDKVKVYGLNGQEMSMAWCGGVNNPQFAMADLNRDGKNDLIVLERPTFLRTFINIGNKGEARYRYDQRYEHNFPSPDNFIKLVDYNKDSIPELWYYGGAGCYTCKGYYNQTNELAFKDCKKVTDTRGVGIQIAPQDLPAIEDIDRDGDVDIVAYYDGGIKIYWYRNLQTDHGLKNELKFELADRCWGKILQIEDQRPRKMGECSSPKPSLGHNKTTGGNHGLCLLDADGDKDFDMLDASYNLADVQFLINGRIQKGDLMDEMIAQDTLWPTGKKRVYLPNFPTAFWLDIDNDDDKDLLFSPMTTQTENYKCIHYYKNTGSDANPDFNFQTDNLFLNEMIDMGSYSYPALYDYNRDGKPDLFVSGSYFEDGRFYSRIAYYENTSTPAQPSFTLKETDFNQLGQEKYIGAVPAMGDLDGDGKDDLLIGRADGTLKFYRNTAASNADIPAWALLQGDLAAGSATIDVGGNAAPIVYDFDKDGYKDLIIGNSKGTLVYYHSLGKATGQKPLLQHVTNTLGSVKALSGMNINGQSAPFIGKLDNSGNEYLLVGNNAGIFFRYAFRHGDTTAFTMLDSVYSQIKVGDGDPQTKTYATATVGDIDGDGRSEMITGLEQGGLQLYEQLFNVNVPPVEQQQSKLFLYPNPASTELIISSEGTIASGAYLRIYSGIGQLVIQLPAMQKDKNRIVADISMLPPGNYLCTLLIDGNIKTALFTKK